MSFGKIFKKKILFQQRYEQSRHIWRTFIPKLVQQFPYLKDPSQINLQRLIPFLASKQLSREVHLHVLVGNHCMLMIYNEISYGPLTVYLLSLPYHGPIIFHGRTWWSHAHNILLRSRLGSVVLCSSVFGGHGLFNFSSDGLCKFRKWVASVAEC